ncbi:MAG: ArsR/SmtB family transcription factor [Actinomycetota bacterium]
MDALFQAVGPPTRRQILHLVWDEELAAGDIAARVTVSWPAVSQHLRVLRDAGVVIERRDGNRRLYRADRKALGPLRRVLEEMWRTDLGRLRSAAEREHRRRRR